MADDKVRLAKAEEFADRMEAQMRELGANGDYFCAAQRERWRQHSIRAYLGSSPGEPDDSRAVQS
ncbi:MAG: hypothetical protein ABSG72_19555 [Candidatus Sulfotelmatobacter sp.]|jgi:hypothetical protein